jgi:formylglycine-generating enzyme required for sulfatase activity
MRVIATVERPDATRHGMIAIPGGSRYKTLRKMALRGTSATAFPRDPHLRAPNYCRRHRPATRHGEAIDTSVNHVGFRCVKRDASA